MNWLTQNWFLIVFGVGLLLLLRRTGCFGGMSHAHHGHSGDGPDHADHVSQLTEAVKSEMATDPVTGKEVQASRAITSVYDGRVYYFETQESRQRFDASPEQYASASVGRRLAREDASERPHSRRHGGCC